MSEPVEISEATAYKIATAKQKKETGDQAFKEGNAKDALIAYHGALLYLLGLDKNALQSVGITPQYSTTDGKPQERSEVDELIEKIYANMSACHLKNKNWQRAQETASKALAKNDKNYKAMFRKGKALGEQGFFEKAVKVLEDLKTKNPADKEIADQEIERLRAIDSVREKVHKQKMKGFLNKAEKKGNTLSVSDDSSTEPQAIKQAFIEEVNE